MRCAGVSRKKMEVVLTVNLGARVFRCLKIHLHDGLPMRLRGKFSISVLLLCRWQSDNRDGLMYESHYAVGQRYW